MRRETADHPDPLWRWRDRHLSLQHRHSVGEARHAIPAKLHVEVEPAADDVQVVIDEAGKHTPSRQVNNPRVSTGGLHNIAVASHRRDDACGDRHGGGRGIRAIETCKAAVPQDKVSTHLCTSISTKRGAGLTGGFIYPPTSTARVCSVCRR